MPDMKSRAEQGFAAVEDDLQALSKWMHDTPEIAFQEYETSRRLAAFLTAHGFAVEHPAYGLDTSFAARVGKAGPEVIICAEYDALPGLGHACGHNLIATAALGAGVALAGLADELGCRVTVLGTPAEEKIGGKVDLIAAGAFQGAAAAMMIHPDSEDTLDPTNLAIVHLSVEYHGQSAHAAASPWEGRNALDAFVQAYVNISTLRQQLKPTDKTHGIITHGGDAPNIIPSFTKSEWYVRALTKARLEVVLQRVRACFEAAATATGCTVTIEPSGHEYADLISDPVMADLFDANASALGRTMVRGAQRNPAAAGSTDMGNVSHVVPSIQPMLDIGSAPFVNHQPEFAEHTLTPRGRQAIRDGALAMAWTVIDLAAGDRWGELTNPGEAGRS
jgi:amidohydrolase